MEDDRVVDRRDRGYENVDGARATMLATVRKPLLRLKGESCRVFVERKVRKSLEVRSEGVVVASAPGRIEELERNGHTNGDLVGVEERFPLLVNPAAPVPCARVGEIGQSGPTEAAELTWRRTNPTIATYSFHQAPSGGEPNDLVECTIDGRGERLRPEDLTGLIDLLAVDDQRGLVPFGYLGRHLIDILARAAVSVHSRF